MREQQRNSLRMRRGRHPVDVPEGYAVDPVCGMSVEVASARFTLEHDDVDYFFCAPVCRKVFAEDLGLSV